MILYQKGVWNIQVLHELFSLGGWACSTGGCSTSCCSTRGCSTGGRGTRGCSCVATSSWAIVAHRASILIHSMIAPHFSCIIIAVSVANCRAIAIRICTVPSVPATLVESTIAIDLSFIRVACSRAHIPAILSIISFSTFHGHAMLWHLTAIGVKSSSTQHLIRVTSHMLCWRANHGAFHCAMVAHPTSVIIHAIIAHFLACIVIAVSAADRRTITPWRRTVATHPTIIRVISAVAV